MVRHQSGMTLIEVLVSVLVLGVAVLGALAMQTNAAKDVRTGYAKGQATAIALDLAERFRGNPDAINVYNDATQWQQSAAEPNYDCRTSSYGNRCDATTMANADIKEVIYKADQVLPSGKVWMGVCPDVVNTNDQDLLCIRVAWNGEDPAGCVVSETTENNTSIAVAKNCVQLSLYNPSAP